MAVKHILTNGQKAISLSQYPDEAWTDLSPSGEGTKDNRKDTEAIANYYNTVAFLFRCVQLRASALTRIPWAIRKGETDIWISDEPTPPQSLLFLKDFRRFLRLTEAALCLSPEAFWFKERNRVRVLSLRWHAPQSVIPQWSESEGLTGFKRLLGDGKSKVFEVEDYIYFAIPNPMHETLPGRPPAQAAMGAAGVLYSVDAFASQFFKQGAIKATLLTVDGNPSPAEMLKLEAWWKRFFSGVKSAWGTAAVRAGVTPVVVGEGMESLSQSELTKERKQDIATALGVPHSLVFSDAANFATSQQDDLHFYDKTLIPEFEYHVETLNAQLFEPMGYAMELRPDEMSVFQADEEQRSMSYLHYVQANMKPSIAAQILGIDLPEGVEYEDLDPEPQPVQLVQAQPEQLRNEDQQPRQVAEDDEQPIPPSPQKAMELARYRRWREKRPRANPAEFRSDILTAADKAGADDGNGFFLSNVQKPHLIELP
jgi:HK97 family phage portal protein